MMKLSTTLTLFGICLCWALPAAHVVSSDSEHDDAASDAADSPRDPWCFRPIPDIEQLDPRADTGTATLDVSVIDHYIRRELQKVPLSPAPRAEPYRQVRRLSLMLTGLPPDPETVDAFVDDPTDEHYARLVDHYLNSPQYGERWARHWMDVVRFAETWGYEWNHLVRDAWRYRDYLIRAFNSDLPYDQLIREHIAGDLLDAPRVNEDLGINESLIGTAFYRFGETGHDDCVLYPEISLDVMDNQIDTLSKAFQALTVSCSRCHDHKLDDIPQRDYYGLLGILASSRQVIRTLDLPHRQDDRKAKLAASKREIRRMLSGLWMNHADTLSAERLNELLRNSAANGHQPAGSGDITHPLFVWQNMTNSAGESTWQDRWNETRNTMTAENDRRVAFNRKNYVLFGDFSDTAGDFSNWGFEGLAVEDHECFTPHGDFSVLPAGPQVISNLLPAGCFSHGLSQKLNAVVRSPLLPEDRKYVSYQAMGQRRSVCRTVIANCTLPYFHTNRFDSAKLAWATVDLTHIRKSRLVPLRSWLEWATALDDQGYPLLNMPQTEYQTMLDNPRSWFGVTKVFVHDVEQPPFEELHAQLKVFESPAAGPDDLAVRYREILKNAVARWSAGMSVESDVFWLNAFIDLELLSCDNDQSTELAELVSEYRKLEDRIETPRRIVGMSDQDSGFDVPLLDGGNAATPQKRVHRSYLTAVESRMSRHPAQRGSGRLRVAELVADPENPLTARVMANRIWHYLFGAGIVRSVDNFGNLGDAPSHPELLDYLARRLIDSGWSVKALIREIVLSDTFRQSSVTSGDGRQKDPENRLFHRYPSRRMEAEVIRDSMLCVSGRLDLTMFGPSIDPHRAEDIDSRKLYSGPLDGNGRRSLYLKVTRMGPPKLLELFNFPDPSMTRGRRDSTNVPSQALGLMNHPFVHQQAHVHAARLIDESGANITFESALDRLFLTLFSRRPTEVERNEYTQFFGQLATAHGDSSPEDALHNSAVWQDLIHTLYNLKEFTYVL
ncbi:MAG: DUF1549 and DUF1553 domain-containing protein [Planctomycetaceae bacterium]